jgi:phenylpropionate dioxygenase-like ring-hydroxylating dioxygenase large terminal subunit
MSNPQIFNNWDIVAAGWYILCASRQIKGGTVRSFTLCGQRIAAFRSADGRVSAFDAYCPHMGTDLGIGQVDGNEVRCFFHHWAFDRTGNCTKIPCQTDIPPTARLQAYATEEKYGFIWVYPEAIAPTSVPEFDELRDRDSVVRAERPLERHAHHHICMMNGIDAQHLRTVHNLDVEMELSLQPERNAAIIDFTLTGNLPQKTRRDRLLTSILGNQYTYTMCYAHGCIGMLTMMKNVRRLPPLHLIYAFTPLASGKTQVQPIYITRKRSGIVGWIASQILLLLTQFCYYFLRDEDGKIYDNIRFNSDHLLAIDAPIQHYMDYVNTLKPSRWSKWKWSKVLN